MSTDCNLLPKSGGQPRRKLTAETIERAEELTSLGLPMAAIAAGLRVHRSTLTEWIAAGNKPGASGLEADLADAIQRARVEGEGGLVQHLHKMAANGDTRAATWLLSHSPSWRDTWSDASHARREVATVVGLFVAALQESSTLTNAQREEILLRVRAMGVAMDSGDGEGEW